MKTDTSEKSHRRKAFRHRDFRFFSSARFLALTAHQVLILAVSQAVYEMTQSPLHLGYIGLSLFLPKFGLTLFAGHTADRYDRRSVILFCRIFQITSVIGLILFFHYNFYQLWIVYGLLLLMGTANSFDGPASQALVTQLVPTEDFSNAVTWTSSLTQIAFIIGPSLGGWLYGMSGHATLALTLVAALRVVSAFLISRIHPRTDHIQKTEVTWKSLMAGIHYVFEKKIILGAISLDLFAVLLGGAVALMPIYANDILKVGPSGLGLLRAAPPVGAALIALLMAYRPPIKREGSVMLWCVAIFGVATILFGISTNFYFSLFCLLILGASDMISVVIRGVLVQMQTPPVMRGRVSAINFIFIGASNELGEFESGLTASWFGIVPSVILGGLGTLAVVALWAKKFPELRKYEQNQNVTVSIT